MRSVVQKLLLKRLEEENYTLDPMEYARPTFKLVFVPAKGDWMVRIEYHIYGMRRSRILGERELFYYLTGALKLSDL